MARPLRIEYEGAIYHVTSRGNEKKTIFKDDEDRKIFLNNLKKVKERYNWLYHAYCLMNNHYHLVIETTDGNLSKGMRQLNGVYTQGFNRRHNRIGHVFQGRYKAIIIQKESHLLEVCRYVVLNPIRAGVVGYPNQWEWSSYCNTIGEEKKQSFLTTDWILSQFGRNMKEAKERYKEFVVEGIGKESIWREVKRQNLLGRDNFIKMLAKYIKHDKGIEEIPRKQRYFDRPELNDLFRIILPKKIRNEKIIEAVENFGYSQKEIADYLGMHYSTISRLINEKS